jgi:lipopolysaccharide biosynthesis glycosyltransferase
MTFKDEDMIAKLVNNNDSKKYIYHLDVDFLKKHVHIGYTVETYLRLLMPWTLPEKVGKVLYLDTDILVKGNISGLFALDLSGYALAACLDNPETAKYAVKSRNDIFERTNDHSYYNAGVMLWNLDYIRERYCFDDFMKVILLFGDRLIFNDQDVLNYMFYRNTMSLESNKYNSLVNGYDENADFEDIVSKAAIIHYAGGSPWQVGEIDRYDIKMWWEEAKKTPYYDEIYYEMVGNITVRLQESKKQIRFLNDKCTLLNNYILFKQEGRHVDDCRIFSGVNNVAIYGAGVWAQHLLNELENSRINVKYVFDKNKSGHIGKYEIVSIDEIQKANECDLIVITPLKEYKSILKCLKCIVHCSIAGIKDCFK